MADHKNRGGQKKGREDADHPEQAEGTTTGGTGERSDKDKQRDQRTNPDDAHRTPTDEQR